ncbi:MAG: biotin--[acetyl-CoA-carboxylase] ligase, partial [Candidatus Aenigmatarchaeota archaeon]
MNKKKANKIEILKILKQKEIVSGKVIAQQLGISRTAVWKHIKSLIRKGYLIKISKKGYRLVESNNSLCEEEFSELPIKVYCFEKVTSTMDIARKLLQKTEKKEEVLILAETQTYGRGRLGRTWISPPGGIWMSLIINPDLDLKSSFILTYVASLATALSIEENTGIKVSLKWPNDILYQEKKLGGILLEIQAEPDKLKN